jgi:hypothetical protein
MLPVFAHQLQYNFGCGSLMATHVPAAFHRASIPLAKKLHAAAER